MRAYWARAVPRPRLGPMASSGFAAVALGHRPVMPLRPSVRPCATYPLDWGTVLITPPPTPIPAIAQPAIEVVNDVAIARRPKRSAAEADLGDPDDVQREASLVQWRSLLESCGLTSSLFAQMADEPELADASFRASFHGKPAATLVKRAGSLLQYVRWAASSGHAPFPLHEPTIFSYLTFLATEGAPPSRGQSFREALGFAKGFIGLGGVDAVLASRRVHGQVLASLDRRREKRQRDVLPVIMVKSLEELVCSSTANVGDKIFAGFVLLCLHARARVGDALRADREPHLDVDELGEGFIEAGFLRHKTSFRAKAKTRLPAVAHATGVTGLPWAERWLSARAALGLDANIDGYILPASLAGEPEVIGRATTTMVTIFLREFLASLDCDWVVSNIGSHSLKATLLSWAAKFGLPPTVRRKLGGHSKPKERSTIAYSRDELAGPLRQLKDVLDAVKLGRFDPDATRSGRWNVARVGVEPTVPVESEGVAPSTPVLSVPLPACSSPPASSSSCDESTSDDEHVDEQPGFVYNPRSGIYHSVDEINPSLMRCGRPVVKGAVLVDLGAVPNDAAVRCANGCFRR